MRDTVHLEGIQPDLPWHLVSLAPAGYGTCTVGHYGRRNEISTRWTRMNCARGRCRLKTKAKRVCMDSALDDPGFEPSVPLTGCLLKNLNEALVRGRPFHQRAGALKRSRSDWRCGPYCHEVDRDARRRGRTLPPLVLATEFLRHPGLLVPVLHFGGAVSGPASSLSRRPDRHLSHHRRDRLREYDSSSPVCSGLLLSSDPPVSPRRSR